MSGGALDRLIVGRVGSGKSALFASLLQTEEHVIPIAPESLALGYVSNSNILAFVSSLGVNLDIFFRLLWRHVMSVEIIRSRFEIRSEQANAGFFEWVAQHLRKDKHQQALNCLEKWGREFWQDTDYRIREVTRTLETDLKAQLKSHGLPIEASIDGGKKVTEEQKHEIIERAQTVVNAVQAALERWRESGLAPASVLATRVQPPPSTRVYMTRPLCPYPQVAAYSGVGSTRDAGNFTCRVQ